MIHQLTKEAIKLLKKLISKQSFSGEENETALLIMHWFSDHDIKFVSDKHNVWAKNRYFDGTKKTILLNSHHDTVKPGKGWSTDPFDPVVSDGGIAETGEIWSSRYFLYQEGMRRSVQVCSQS